MGGEPGTARSRVVRIKVISMGDVGTGKSCLIKRYCEEKFISKYIPTIGIDYGVKPVKIGNHEIRVNLWDLAGSPDYLEVRNEFYKDSQAALLVYDVTNRPSFEALSSWVAEAAKYGAPSNMAVFVAANKVDLPGRKVSEAEGRDWAAARGYPYLETSAASGRGVVPLFASLFSTVISQLPQMDYPLLQCAAQEAAAACQADGIAQLKIS